MRSLVVGLLLAACARIQVQANDERNFCAGRKAPQALCKPACRWEAGSTTKPVPAACYTQRGVDNAKCANFLHIAGLFPTTGSLCFDGLQTSYSAQLAVNDINLDHTNTGSADIAWMHPHLLSLAEDKTGSEFCLVMHHNDTEGDPGMGMKHADDFLDANNWYNYSHIDFFVGALSSDVTQSIQHLVQHNKLPQISYASTSPVLSDKVMFPTLVRTIPSDGDLITGVAKFVRHMEWEILTILAVNLEFGQAGGTLLHKQLGSSPKVDVTNNLLFTEGDIDNIQLKLGIIKESESRVIFLHCGVTDAVLVLTIAQKLGMLEEGFTWIGTEWAQDSLFEEFAVMVEKKNPDKRLMTTEAAAKLTEEMAGMIAVRPAHSDVSDKAKTVRKHIDDTMHAGVFNQSSSGACVDTAKRAHVSTYAYFAYDAVLVAAQVLTNSVKSNMCHQNGLRGCRNFTHAMEELRNLETPEAGMAKKKMMDTHTATGQIILNPQGDRIMNFDIVNMRMKESAHPTGYWHKVGTYKSAEKELLVTMDDQSSAAEDRITWAGNVAQIPSDRVESHVSLEALYLFFFLSFIVLAICVGNFLHAHQFYALPESGATIIFGAMLGGLLVIVAEIQSSAAELTAMTEFDTEMFTLILLPIIIFAAGFNLKKADFFRNTVPILLTAFIGTGISTVFVGYGCVVAGDLGLFSSKSTKMGTAEAMAYGALVSAVDPVATLAVFGALGVETDLNMRVFGESVLNDGVSIVLFRVFGGFITEPLNAVNVAGGIGTFFYIVICSVITGIVVAMWLSLMLKYGNLHSYILEASMVLLSSYVAFTGAESMHQSGIIASLFCGIAMNHWTYHNFTYDGEVLARRVVKMFSLMADTVIFFQVGQNIVVNVVDPDWGFIGVTLTLCLFGRMLNIFPLCALYNCCAKEDRKIPMNHQVVMLHSGLRGAIAFALALDFPSQHKHIVINTCMWVILFTIFINGGTTPSLLGALGVDMGCDSNDVASTKKSKHSKEINGFWQKVDRMKILPMLTWRFRSDGEDTYIEDPREARAERLGLDWNPADPNAH